MKRFYKKAEAIPLTGETGFGISIDGKTLRTPGKRPLTLPTAALAEAISAEWEAQQDEVRPHTMPLMRLASTGIDIVAVRREAVIDEVAKYAGTDLVCYRAVEPPALVSRQQAVWGPLIDWATLRFDAPLTVTSGIVPVAQHPNTLRALRTAVEAYPTLPLTALQSATAACGSLVIALALLENRLDVAGAFEASQLDETFQIEQWGEDAEAARRRASLAEDIAAAARFHSLLKA